MVYQFITFLEEAKFNKGFTPPRSRDDNRQLAECETKRSIFKGIPNDSDDSVSENHNFPCEQNFVSLADLPDQSPFFIEEMLWIGDFMICCIPWPLSAMVGHGHWGIQIW